MATEELYEFTPKANLLLISQIDDSLRFALESFKRLGRYQRDLGSQTENQKHRERPEGRGPPPPGSEERLRQERSRPPSG